MSRVVHKGTQLAVALALALLAMSPRSAAAAAATDIRIRATVGPMRVGGIGTYAVTIVNRGSAATDVPIHVRTRLPNGIALSTFTGNDWICSANGADVDCVYSPSLDVNRSTTFRLRVSACTAAFPSVTTTFVIDYPGDIQPANNAITKTRLVRQGTCGTPPPTVTPRSPGPIGTPTMTPTPTAAAPTNADLQLTKTLSSQFRVGTVGTYSLGVSNLGPEATNTVKTIIDSLPAGLTYVSGVGTGWTCSASGQTVTCTSASPLLPGDTANVTLTVAVGGAAYPTVTNIALVSYAGDPDTTNNTAQRPTTIRM